MPRIGQAGVYCFVYYDIRIRDQDGHQPTETDLDIDHGWWS
jgi:hypothetical protein